MACYAGKKMQTTKKKPGVIIISAFLILNGAYTSYQLVQIWLRGLPSDYNLLYNLLPFIFLVSGIGLYLMKGWGRNIALLSGYCYGFIGLIEILTCLTLKAEFTNVIKGVTNLIIATAMLLYLYKRNVKEIFAESPISLMLIGLFFALSGFVQRADIVLIEYFWRLMSLVGLGIIFKAGKQLRNNSGSITCE